MTQLLYDPVDLSNYAKRGDPPIEEWPGIPVGRERIMASAGDPRDWFRYGHRLKAAEKAWAEWADARNRRRDFTSGYTWNQILILGDYGSGKTTLGTGAGFLYLAVVVDVFSRRVVGWAWSPTSVLNWSSGPSTWPYTCDGHRVSSTTLIRGYLGRQAERVERSATTYY